MAEIISALTPEFLAQCEQNRVASPYVRNFQDDGVEYPIPDLIGSSRLIAVDEASVGAREVTFGLSEFAPGGAVHKPHTHNDCEEIMYILAGEGIGGLRDTVFVAREGDIIFVPKGVEHYFYNPFAAPCRFVFLYTKGSLKAAGYALKSTGYNEQGAQIESRQRAGTNTLYGE